MESRLPRTAVPMARKRHELSSGMMRIKRVAPWEGRGISGGSDSRDGLGLRERERGGPEEEEGEAAGFRGVSWGDCRWVVRSLRGDDEDCWFGLFATGALMSATLLSPPCSSSFALTNSCPPSSLSSSSASGFDLGKASRRSGLGGNPDFISKFWREVCSDIEERRSLIVAPAGRVMIEEPEVARSLIRMAAGVGSAWGDSGVGCGGNSSLI